METIPLRSDHVMLRALTPSVGTARRFVRQALAGSGLERMADDVELVASELVTNSVNATGGGVSWVTVSLYLHEASVLLEVWDASPERPVFRESGVKDTHGRGLVIVEALSSRWGCRWPPFGGKIVWAECAEAAGPADEMAAMSGGRLSSL